MDDGDGLQNAPDAGFDLDAVEAMIPPTGIRILDAEAGFLKVVPNPSCEIIGIRLMSRTASGNLIIYNTRGQEVITKQIMNGFLQVDIHTLPDGIYLIKFIGGNVTRTLRFIKR
jgi:hypothetical protein